MEKLLETRIKETTDQRLRRLSESPNNTDAADDFVTVVDNNLNPPATVLNSQRINQNSTPVQIQVEADGNGNGTISWSAVRCNDATASNNGAAQPSNFDSVNVSAT